MRIDLNIAGARGSNEAARGNVGQNSASPASGRTSDAARFSSGRASVQALSATVQQMAEIRQERVTALTQMISSGSYQVSSKQLAAALITHMTEPASS
jgi:flagellar biosynthesis anti-sigma factor FlgM